MLDHFIKKLELRRPITSLVEENSDLFRNHTDGRMGMNDAAFESLLQFLDKGEQTLHRIAVQVGVRWAAGPQRIELRKHIAAGGVKDWACLWAMRRLRSGDELLLREYEASDICFMQILLLRELEFQKAAPFIVERFLIKRGVSDDLRSMALLALTRLLDQGVSLEMVRDLQARYPQVEALARWRPGIPVQTQQLRIPESRGHVDFSQMVRSVQDMKSFASLTRTAYLLSLFYVPLKNREWSSLLLTKTDHLYFGKLALAGVIESCEHGSMMSSSPFTRRVINDFLFESYGPAKEIAKRNEEAKKKEEREKKVRTNELDRHALAIAPDGIICVEGSGRLYYMNPAAERILEEDPLVKEGLFGDGPLEEALKQYSPANMKERVKSLLQGETIGGEIFGDRISFVARERRYDITLGKNVILIRDTTDQRLVDEEIGKLYRHEMHAALDVLGAGLNSAMDMLRQGMTEESIQCLEQVERKRADLVGMLRERIDFIRLHSDSFRIKPLQFNLNLALEKVVDRYTEKAAAKSVKIESNHREAPVIMVNGEERFLQRAIDNVVRNAIKFAPDNSAISVLLNRTNNDIQIDIADCGPGIPSENLDKIFRLGYTTNGDGRGLYLAKRIMSAHGGRISVRNKDESGCLFRLSMPALKGETHEQSNIRAHCG
jgi:signal transduction histidine kinase